jgi:hypothetical protein
MDRDGGWTATEAHITGEGIEVDIPSGVPLGLRYAFHNDSDPNLFNTAGLPASCFEILIDPSTIN